MLAKSSSRCGSLFADHGAQSDALQAHRVDAALFLFSHHHLGQGGYNVVDAADDEGFAGLPTDAAAATAALIGLAEGLPSKPCDSRGLSGLTPAGLALALLGLVRGGG